MSKYAEEFCAPSIFYLLKNCDFWNSDFAFLVFPKFIMNRWEWQWIPSEINPIMLNYPSFSSGLSNQANENKYLHDKNCLASKAFYTSKKLPPGWSLSTLRREFDLNIFVFFHFSWKMRVNVVQLVTLCSRVAFWASNLPKKEWYAWIWFHWICPFMFDLQREK